jgi:hypothetical protein
MPVALGLRAGSLARGAREGARLMARGCQTEIEPPGAPPRVGRNEGEDVAAGRKSSRSMCSTSIAAELLREGPSPLGLADDRGRRNRAEVAAVERRRLIWVHEKDLVVGNHPAACPSWKGAPRAVALVRRPNSGSIEVAALVEEGCKRLGRHDHERGNGRNADRPHGIEPDGTLSAVPMQ